MNKSAIKKYALLLGLAAVLSLAIIRTHSQDNVPFCINAAGCTFDNQPKGQVIVRSFGFPVTYRETSVFKPNNGDQNKPNYAGFSSAQSERRGISKAYILVNIVFWFALLKLLSDVMQKYRSRTSKPVSDAEPKA